MKKISAIFCEHTTEFVKQYIVPEGCEILEVGCGDGDLAMHLIKLGAKVTGIDTDKQMINSAQEKGLDAKNISILNYHSKQKYDMVFFTRSLHHIHELEACLLRSRGLLKDSGLLILEEFDLKNINLSTLKWYYEQLAANIPHQEPSQNNLVHRWDIEHYHNPALHNGGQMIEKIEQMFTIHKIERCAYLYRNICNALPNNPENIRLARNILTNESNLILEGKILPVGLRVIARKTTKQE